MAKRTVLRIGRAWGSSLSKTVTTTAGGKIGKKPAKMRSDEYVDSLINGSSDGMRIWAHGYDDDGGLGALDDELVRNIAGVLRKAHELVAFAKAYGFRTGVLEDRDPLTPRAIRRIAARLAQEGSK